MDMGMISFDYAAEKSPDNGYIQRFGASLNFMPRSERPFSIVKPKEFALIDVAGALKGGRSEFSFFGGYQTGIDSMQENIRRAAKDPFIDGIMLKIGGFAGGLSGMAMMQELRSELIRFKQTNKKVVAYIDGSALGEEYYLASVADKIIAPAGASIGGFGKSVAIYRTSGLFEKLGIEYQVFSKGKYKDALGPYNKSMTKEQKAMIESIVSDLYRQMLSDIAKDRNMKLEKIREMDSGIILTAKEAKEKGLIDEIGYYNTAMASASKICGGRDEPAQLIAPEQVNSEEFFFNQVFGVAVIEIDGELITGVGGENIIFGGRYVGSQTIAEYIKKASDDSLTKAIVLRINSPGGDAIAAGEIYQALKYAREKQKKIIASMGNIAASGGYYIACAADKIVADPSSITGSIGVIGYFPLHKKLMKKLDLKADVIKEGKYADMFSGLREMTTEEVKIIEKLQDQAYDDFLSAVVEGRKMPTKEADALAQGRIYTGNQAVDLKLVDSLGSFSDAVDLAKKESGIPGEARLIFYHQPSMFFNFGAGLLGTKFMGAALPWMRQDKLPLQETPYLN
jgi:protease-4